jgi:hypothetical protein
MFLSWPTPGYMMAGEVRRVCHQTGRTGEVRDHEGSAMNRTRLTAAERETIIRTSEAEEGWVVYSDSPAMIRQLRALLKRVGGKKEPAQTSTGYRCVVPKTAVNVLVARRRYHPLTGEERQARVARLRRKAPSSAEERHQSAGP